MVFKKICQKTAELSLTPNITCHLPQFNVTEVVIELDSSSQEIRRTVTLISESESKIQAARECPMFKCAPLLGCAARKKDSAGCQTCECAG